MSLGLTPELEQQVRQIRDAWKREHNNSPRPQPVPEVSQRQVSAGFATRAASMLQSRWARVAFMLVFVVGYAVNLRSGTITGQIQTPTGGIITNGTLGFKLSQPAVLSGTALLATQQGFCYTSTVGNIVGLPDPLALPVVTTNTASGTLAAGTYYTKVTYYGAGGESVASPETTTVLGATGTLIVNAPLLQPVSATGYKVYIGSSAGAETLQATVTGFTQYSQTSALAAGTALPSSNTTVCSIAFSDQLIPTGTYYSVSFVNKNGSSISGFPETWCTFGGAAGTINVSNGAPTGNCGSNGVFYPTPIIANPQNNAPQSISSPLTLTGTLTANAGGSLGGGYAITCKSLNSIQCADQFVGADCGAKINAASVALNGPGEIWVDQACGTTWTTPVLLSNGQVLRFIQGGTYVASGNGAQMIAAIGTSGTHKSNVHVIGDGIGTTYLQAQSTGAQLGALVQFQYCDDCSVENFTLDGNSNTTVNLVDEMDTRFLARNLRLLADTTYNAARDYCIHVRGSIAGNYENIHAFGGSQDAILVGVGPFSSPTQAAQQNTFTNITTTNSPASGLDVSGISGLIVQNNFFSNVFIASNGSTGILGDDRYGLNLNYSNNNTFNNITTITNSWSGIRINGGSNNVFTGLFSAGNGTAGANTGDAIRLEVGTVSVPNKNNVFQGVAQAAGTNFAVGTAGSNTSANYYMLAIGTSTVNFAAGATTDFFFLVDNNNAVNMGPWGLTETTALAGGIAGQDLCYGDSTAHAIKCSYNNGTYGVLNLGSSVTGTYFVTSDFTVAANTNLQAITGLSWTMPANIALNSAFSCHLMYSQATAAVADQFGIQDVTVAPTNLGAKSQVWTSTSASTAGNLPTLATTTATAIVTFTPSATATVFNADIDGFIEQPSNAATSAVNLMVQTSNASDLITVKRDSFCRVY